MPKFLRKSRRRKFADVDAVEGDAAFLHFVEAQEQVGEGGLSGAGVAHHRHRFTRLDGEADVVQNFVVVLVGEPDLMKFHLPHAGA